MTTDEELFREIRSLEKYGYIFHITSREWKIEYSPAADSSPRRIAHERVLLKIVTHFEDDGGSDSRNHEMLGRDNTITAIGWANAHLAERLKREFAARLSSGS